MLFLLLFVHIVFHVDPASGLSNTINVCVCVGGRGCLASILGHSGPDKNVPSPGEAKLCMMYV